MSLGHFTEPESISARAGVAGTAGTRFGPYVWFSTPGRSLIAFRFENTRASYLSAPGPEPGTEFRFELSAKFGVGRSKLGVPGHIHPEIKGQWLNWIFFFENGEWRNWNFFF